MKALQKLFPFFCITLLFFLYTTKPDLPIKEKTEMDIPYMTGQVVATHPATSSFEGTENSTLSISYEDPVGGTLLATIPYERRETDKARKVESGTRIIVGKMTTAEGTEELFVADIYRLHTMWALLALFILVTLFCAGKAGLRSFLGLLMASGILWWYVIPRIASGAPPFLTSIIGTFLIATTALYLAHDIRATTSIALGSIGITASIAAIVSHLSVSAMRLSGMGSEEALFLDLAPGVSISTTGLLMGGILIGALGVLDDITTAQAAAVSEIARANKTLPKKELFLRGMQVGKEHILSLVNTLVLAYAGASFPLLLLLYVYERPLWVVVNSEIIMEEIVRTLVGSTALILAVPITTAIAAWYFALHPPKEHESHPHTHTHK